MYAVTIEMQKKTKNFLWGIFLVTKKSLALVPGTSNQAAQSFDAGDVVDNTAKVCLLPSPLCFLSQKPFNYQMLAVDSFWLESIIYIFKVLVLDSDVVCFACFFFFFICSGEISVNTRGREFDRCVLYLKKIGNSFVCYCLNVCSCLL